MDMSKYFRPSNLPVKNPRKTAVFVMVGTCLMIAIHMVFLGGFEQISKAPQEMRMQRPKVSFETLAHSEIKDYKSSRQILKFSDKQGLENLIRFDEDFWAVPQPESHANVPLEQERLAALPDNHAQIPETLAQPEKPMPELSVPKFKNPKIAIIIDDLGLDQPRTRQVMALDAPLTLAFLPYAPQLPEITAEAKATGHELLIHTPMQPLNRDLNPGPLALLEGMEKGEFDQALNTIFDSFEGYVGINNHMGSRLTQDEAAMGRVMKALAERGLIFVDSKTIHTSVAARVAAENGIPFAERDVFLDHVDTIEFVKGALKKTEEAAYRKGYAIAIGHPKDATIQGLREWLPGLKEKGIEIVPVSRLVSTPKAQGDDSLLSLKLMNEAQSAARIKPSSGNSAPSTGSERY